MNPIKEALTNWKAASSSVEGFRALVRALREVPPEFYDYIFDNGGLLEFLADGNLAKIDARFVDFWVGRAAEGTKAFEMELTDAEKAEWESALASLRVFLLEKGARNGFPRNPENLDMESAGLRKRASERGGECVARKEVALGAEGEAASSQVDGLPAERRGETSRRRNKERNNPHIKEIRASERVIWDVFARYGAKPKYVDGTIRALFCPMCISTIKGKKGQKFVVEIGPYRARYVWTCHRCHKRGTTMATGDAIEAEMRFQGAPRSDFLTVFNQLAGGIVVPARSAVMQASASPDETHRGDNSRQGRMRCAVASGIQLSHEARCLAVIVSEPTCPGTFRELVALVVDRTGMLPNTVRGIFRRWRREYSKQYHKNDEKAFFKDLSDKLSDAARYHFLHDAAGKGVFSSCTGAAVAMLYVSIRNAGEETWEAAVSFLAKNGNCSTRTVIRCLNMFINAGIFFGKVINRTDRGRGNGPKIKFQWQPFTNDDQGLSALKCRAAGIQKKWEGVKDVLGRDRRWGLKRFIDTVKSLSEVLTPLRPAGEG